MLAAAGVVAFGVVQLPKTPVDVLPEFSPPYVEVQTEALGLSAQEVEQLITAPMEADLLSQVAFLHQIHSESVPGLSSIQLVFEPGTDPLRARQLVQERLTEAHALPRVTKPPAMLQPLSSTGRVMMVGLSSRDLSLIEMSVLARWNIRPRLMGVPGVANVAVFGQREQQLQVQVDPERLAANGVVLNQVIRTTANALWVSPLSFVQASSPGTGGFIDTPNQRLGIQHVLPITAPEHLEQVAVEGVDGRILRLGDVANVEQDHQPLIGDAVVEDGPSLMLVVEKFPDADAVDVTHAVEAALEDLSPGLSGVTMDTTVFRPATFIETATRNLGVTALVGLALALLVLAGSVLSWRITLVCLVAVVASLVAAGVVLDLAGIGFNALVVAGLVLAVAVVVGDATADAYALGRRRRRSPDEPHGGDPATDLRSDEDITRISLRTRAPLGYATLILVVAVVPVLLVGGLTGELLRPMLLAYLVAVAASMVVALTVTPALMRMLPPELHGPKGEPRAVRALSDGFPRVLTPVVRRSGIAALVAGVLAVGAIAVVPLIGRPSIVPEFQDRDLLVSWQAPPGTSHPEMSRITAAVTSELRSLPGVRNVGAHVGRAVTSDQITGISSGELWVSLEQDAGYSATVAAVRDVVNGYPGMRRDVRTYPQDRLEDASAQDAELVVRVYGEDWQVLREKAREVQALLLRTDGVADPRMDLPVEEPTLQIEVDLAAAEQFGIKPGDARRAAATVLSGIEVGNLFEEQKVFEVVVIGEESTRGSVGAVSNLLIDTPQGRQARLGDIADVRMVPSPSVIEHDSVSRRIDVVADITARDSGSVVDTVEEGLRTIDFALEYHAELLEDDVSAGPSGTEMLLYAGAAVIVALLLLQAAFGSWRLAALLMVLLPLGAAGGVFALALLGGTVAATTMLALLAVVGLSARTDVQLLWAYRDLEARAGGGDAEAVVLRGTTERLVPTLLPAVMVTAVLLPFAVRGPVPGLELVHPLALVLLAGLVTSTLTSLFVLPALYARHVTQRRPLLPRQRTGHAPMHAQRHGPEAIHA